MKPELRFNLGMIEQRVLGVLIEKDMATPEYYPLSLNALVSACNQKNNREPVMQLGESEALNSVEAMRHSGLAFELTNKGHKVFMNHLAPPATTASPNWKTAYEPWRIFSRG